jgi:hypothetical protein
MPRPCRLRHLLRKLFIRNIQTLPLFRKFGLQCLDPKPRTSTPALAIPLSRNQDKFRQLLLHNLQFHPHISCNHLEVTSNVSESVVVLLYRFRQVLSIINDVVYLILNGFYGIGLEGIKLGLKLSDVLLGSKHVVVDFLVVFVIFID